VEGSASEYNKKTFRSHKNAWNFLLAKDLLAFQERLCSMELASLVVALLFCQALYISTQVAAFIDPSRITKVTHL
jgi:hypothetical protein